MTPNSSLDCTLGAVIGFGEVLECVDDLGQQASMGLNRGTGQPKRYVTLE
jgi:hypothetical protein